MKINSDSFIAGYYKFMFNYNLPKDFCTLLWNTVISIALLPMAIAAAFPLWKDESWDGRSLFAKWFNGSIIWIVSLLVAALGYGLMSKLGFTFHEHLPFVLEYIIGLVAAVLTLTAIICVIGIIVFTVDGIKWLFDKYREYRYTKQINEKGENSDEYVYKEPKESKIVIIWNTIRNKYCTKIEWTNGKDAE